jgi:hypothetical protein
MYIRNLGKGATGIFFNSLFSFKFIKLSRIFSESVLDLQCYLATTFHKASYVDYG